MARYVDVEKLIAEYDRVHVGPAGGARKLMVDAPTADVVEVKHGMWVGNWDFSCSECGKVQLEFDPDEPYNYCPNCGAKMDGVTEKGGAK